MLISESFSRIVFGILVISLKSAAPLPASLYSQLKTCAALALTDTVLYAVAGPVLTLTGQLPGRTLAAVVLIVAVGLAMAVCCAALSHLTRKAAELKQENDLTI